MREQVHDEQHGHDEAKRLADPPAPDFDRIFRTVSVRRVLLASVPVAHVDEMAGDRRCRRHRRRYEMSASLKSLAALEIAV